MRSSRPLGRALSGAVLAGLVVGAIATPAAAHSAPLTKAQARAVANRINLRASDFPGYAVQAYKPTKADKAAAKQYATCVDAAPTYVDVSSAAFNESSDSYGFSSETSFVTSPATVRRDARGVVTSHGQQCLKQQLASAATEAGASNPTVTLESLTESSVPGLDAFFGFQFTITFTVIGQQASLYGYDIGFGRGNAEVSLSETGTTSEPKTINNAPLTTLIGRAKKQVPAGGLALKS